MYVSAEWKYKNLFRFCYNSIVCVCVQSTDGSNAPLSITVCFQYKLFYHGLTLQEGTAKRTPPSVIYTYDKHCFAQILWGDTSSTLVFTQPTAFYFKNVSKLLLLILFQCHVLSTQISFVKKENAYKKCQIKSEWIRHNHWSVYSYCLV